MHANRSANRYGQWIVSGATLVPALVGGFRVLLLALRNEWSIGAVIGEMLGALALSIPIYWTLRLLFESMEPKHRLAALVGLTVTLATAGLIYLPKEISLLAVVILLGVCQIVIAACAATALRPKLAAAFARRVRRSKK